MGKVLSVCLAPLLNPSIIIILLWDNCHEAWGKNYNKEAEIWRCQGRRERSHNLTKLDATILI